MSRTGLKISNNKKRGLEAIQSFISGQVHAALFSGIVPWGVMGKEPIIQQITNVPFNDFEVQVAPIYKLCFPCSMSSGFYHVSHDV